jgi:hypothetical protein
MKFKIAEELSTFNFGTDFTNAGRSYEKKLTEKDVDAEQLEMGINVEMEHTVNKDIAKKIALDHLAKIKDYYTRLKKMEDKAKKEGEKEAEDSEEEKEEEGDEKDEKDDEDESENENENEKEDKENSMKV